MVMKRKSSVHSACIDPKKKETQNKPLTKADLIQEIKTLKSLNIALEEELKKKDETIADLKSKVTFDANEKIPTVSISTETQTLTKDINIPCLLCVYVASCEEELNWHMGEEHDTEKFFDTDFPCDVCGKWCRSATDLINHLKRHDIGSTKKRSDSRISQNECVSCNFCDENFTTKHNLMMHNKRQHRDKVSLCWNSSQGACTFGDELCWFIHGETSERISEVLNCRICEKEFPTKNNLLLHKKNEHRKFVQKCQNITNCRYVENCWFLHEEQENEYIENRNMIERLVNKIENLTKKIINLENKI